MSNLVEPAPLRQGHAVRGKLLVAVALLYVASAMGSNLFAQAKAVSNYERCLKDSSRNSCKHLFYVRHNQTRFSEKPSDALLATDKVGEPAGSACRTNWSLNRQHKGWIYCNSFGKNGLWTEAKYMAGIEDFRRVIGCWPIASFHHETKGDFALLFEADTEGRVSFGGELGESPGQARHPGKGRLYFTENLILFGRSKATGFVYGYDPATQTLSSKDKGEIRVLKLQPPEKLIGCAGGLKLAPVRRT